MELPCIVTPNSVEAEALSKVSIRDLESMKRAAETIVNLYGVKAVIIKGGHISGEKSVDLLYDGKDFEYVSYPRVSQRNTHGTGSLFAAALTALLAKGFDLNSSFLKAKEIVYQAILDGLEIGKGIGPVDPVSSLERRAMRFEVIEEMNELAEFIRDSPKFYLLIPEVQSNVAHSIPTPYVRDLCDIATYKGRITRYGDSAVKVNLPAVFCRPTHTARLLFSIIEKGVKANTLMNIRFDPKVVSLFKDMGIDVVEVNRELEPRGEEGKSMQWIVDFLSNTYGKIPGVIYDTGTKGKEAMIRFWASSMEEFKDRIKTLLRGL
jgi:predicted fused transcriptional regulator/phosphomethylpyrimidine kinase